VGPERPGEKGEEEEPSEEKDPLVSILSNLDVEVLQGAKSAPFRMTIFVWRLSIVGDWS
jgi:hypothetical protein